MDSGNIIIEARKKLSASGVRSVTGFDDTQIEAETADGLLLIRGGELKIENFDAESGELSLSGRIDGMVYTQREPKKSLVSRIFG